MTRLLAILAGRPLSGSRRVLSADTLASMVRPRWRPRRRDRPSRSFGLRIGRLEGRPIARHTGWFAAHRSALAVFPGTGTGVFVVVNCDDGAEEEIVTALMRLLAEAMRDGA